MWGKIFDLEEIRPTLWCVVSQYTKSKFRSKKKKIIISFSNKRNKISEKSQKFLFPFTNTGEKRVNIWSSNCENALFYLILLYYSINTVTLNKRLIEIQEIAMEPIFHNMSKFKILCDFSQVYNNQVNKTGLF